MRVAFTIDLEPDCPPFLWGFRGVEEGMPKLLDLLDRVGIPGTFFTTGDVASRFPATVRDLVARGHELACHGVSHRAFTELDADEARVEITESAKTLRAFAPVTSFRAPYLKFPREFVALLESTDFHLDSSQAIYKLEYRMAQRWTGSITRIPASVTSSVLRLPKWIRRAYLSALRDPVVLFVHPWEFVDLRRERLRYDCRFRTGQQALDCVEDVLRDYHNKGARFVRMRELLPSGEQRAA